MTRSCIIVVVVSNLLSGGWNARQRPALLAMKRFHFRCYVNGRLTEDQPGLPFANIEAACAHAIRKMPAGLRRSVRLTANTHIATEVSDETRTVCVVRGKVIIERR